MSLLGIDVGITGCKAVAFDYEGHTLGQAYREYHLYQPQPGWMELDPAEVWAAVSAVVREAAAHAEAVTAGDKVRALAIATHGESVVPVDAAGAPIYRFITAIDTRAVAQMRWWEEKLGAKRLFDITGMPPHPMYTANKLMWLRAYDPAVFNAASRFLCMADFLFTRMGLPPTMDHSLASRTMLQDIRARAWDAELLQLAGLDAERLSRTVPSGTLLGAIAPQVAADLGLAAGAVAVAGGHDHPCGSLGVGAIRAGMVMDSTGTVECVAAAMDKLVLDDNLLRSNLPVEPHTVAGMYLVLGWSSVGGALLKWYRDTFARAEVAEAQRAGLSTYDLILGEATPGPSPVLILPHFVGSGTPALDPISKGAIVGLTLSTTRGQIVKAIIDSVTYEIKLSIDAMEAAGLAIDELRAMGGGAKSSLWLQTKADILGRPVKAMDVSEAPCLGCALLAGIATGVYGSPAEAVARAVRVNRTYEPKPKLQAQYAEKAAVYAEVYPTLKGLNRKL
jgi:xylulokinase